MNYNNNNNNYQDNHNIDHSDNHDDNHTISMDGKASSNTTTTTTTSNNHDDDVSKVDINKVLCHLPTSAKYVLLKDILGSEDYNGNVMIIIIIIIILYIKDGVHGLY